MKVRKEKHDHDAGFVSLGHEAGRGGKTEDHLRSGSS